MFTGKSLKASEIKNVDGFKIIRDGSFSYVTKLESPLEKRLVPCTLEKHIKSCNKIDDVSGLIVPPSLADLVDDSKFLLTSDEPLESAFRIHEEISKIDNFQWENFETVIHPSCEISKNACISLNNVKIGKNVKIFDNAVVHDRTIIEDNCIIGANTVLGCNAFQVFKQKNKPQKIIPQSGGVKICQGVEIQSNCTVSRAIFGGFTEIGSETLIDSQVHVGHDCKIGKKVLIANQSSIAGRVFIEDGAYLAPNITISNGIRVGSNSKITLGSTVITDVAKDSVVTGFGALEHTEWMRQRIMQLRKK
ncbi:MAG: hypothetical protein CMG62_06230 [Candidatus Marinimicrobia bacterium]|nr:hypothetical protein [Candidatus Neomarinimicrobiota bacterium]|tara:strand:+ start:140 stop:1057 length:918 start_codon:yes stop_codon:yes gene_type:complete